MFFAIETFNYHQFNYLKHEIRSHSNFKPEAWSRSNGQNDDSTLRARSVSDSKDTLSDKTETVFSATSMYTII